MSMSGADSGISGVFPHSNDRYVATDDETFSVTSSVLNYKYENGRRYHGFREGNYYAPNDENQNNQLDIFHHVYLMALRGELFVAPIRNPKRILDVGTGTGIWAMDMADKFPDAEVIGTDLSPIQPEWVPPNIRFEIDDAESEWTYGENTFDFIHIRCLFGAIADWPALLDQAYKHLAPGGWIEVAETKLPYDCDDGTLPPNSYLNRWADYAIEAGIEAGRPFDITGKMCKWMKDAKFEQMEERYYKIPIGPWPRDSSQRELGRYNLLNILEGMVGLTTQSLIDARNLQSTGWIYNCPIHPISWIIQWTRIEAQAYYGNLRQEITNPQIHAYYKQYYWTGQKPIS